MLKIFTLKNLILIGFLVGVFVTKLIRLGDFSNLLTWVFWQAWVWQFALWLAGGAVGWQMIRIDQLLWIYFTYPLDKISLYFKELFKQKKIKLIWSELGRYKEAQRHLTTRSALFQAAWAALAIFTVTSTSSYFGKGLLMTLGLYFLLDNWQDQRRNPQVLNAWLFWQIKRPVSLDEQKVYLWVLTGVFGALCLLV